MHATSFRNNFHMRPSSETGSYDPRSFLSMWGREERTGFVCVFSGHLREVEAKRRNFWLLTRESSKRPRSAVRLLGFSSLEASRQGAVS